MSPSVTPAPPPSEQTPLITGSIITDQSEPRAYKKQSRVFHASVTAAIVLLVVLAASFTVYFFFFNSKINNDSGKLSEGTVNLNGSLSAKFSSIKTLIQDVIKKGGFWNEYSSENNTFSSEPVLPNWASEWAANHSSRISSVVLEELKHLGQLSNISSDFEEYTDNQCNITLQSLDVEIVLQNNENLKAPREIHISLLHKRLLAWSPNASDSLSAGFKIIGDTDDIKSLGPISWPNETCFRLTPECRYYSKIILGELSDDENLFEVSETRVADQCSVIAPILLQGHYVNSDTFFWTGGITIYTELPSLNKEEEMSLHTEKKTSFTLSKINGSVVIRDHGVWNGNLPVIFNTTALSWYATDDTIVYPVSWSGFYDRTSFEGVFLLPQKYNESSIRWHDGSFSIQLPPDAPDLFRYLIRTNRVYSSVVYLTSNPSGIDRFDVSVFNKLRDWVFVDYSKVLLVGKFDEDGRFHWSGDASVHMEPPVYELPSTTYRPFGKYLFKILGGELFAQFSGSDSVQKWWSGAITPVVILPSGSYEPKLYANVLAQELIWSYENFTITTGNGTFKSYDPKTNLQLWGSYEFQFSFLMDNIWTTQLQPNVTYHSPILLQYERMTFDFGDDMPERLAKLRQPDLGVFAPITLLGKLTTDKFEWNGECLITVVDV